MIEVENLVKKYGNQIAVDHLSFKIENGQIYGFLGPNGAGKSTTMNMLTGYLAATEGTVRIDGKDILKEARDAKRSIGYLPELPPLYLDMKVREYLDFVAELKLIPKKERKEAVNEVMEKTMITDMSEKLIKNLSKGYKQRVGLAQAIMGNPQTIILDEPTVGLDPLQIIEIRDLIKELGKTHTVILSSHILSEVSAVCDHIMIISKGKLVASDTPEGLQKKMSGGSAQTQAVIQGTKEKVEELLKNEPKIEEFFVEKAEEPDCVKVTMKTDSSYDIRGDLFNIMAENKMPIFSMTRAEKSLEDIFLELTGEETVEESMKQEEA